MDALSRVGLDSIRIPKLGGPTKVEEMIPRARRMVTGVSALIECVLHPAWNGLEPNKRQSAYPGKSMPFEAKRYGRPKKLLASAVSKMGTDCDWRPVTRTVQCHSQTHSEVRGYIPETRLRRT